MSIKSPGFADFMSPLLGLILREPNVCSEPAWT